MHTFLDHCWVCEVRFVTSSPPGPATEERHHIIPTAYGGVDGPQVSLCSKHHDKLHRIAEILPKTNYHHYLSGETTETAQKIMWLATRVYNAKVMFRDDPNRHVTMAITLDPTTKAKVDQLKSVIGVRSREAVIKHAIDHLYSIYYRGKR